MSLYTHTVYQKWIDTRNGRELRTGGEPVESEHVVELRTAGGEGWPWHDAGGAIWETDGATWRQWPIATAKPHESD